MVTRMRALHCEYHPADGRLCVLQALQCDPKTTDRTCTTTTTTTTIQVHLTINIKGEALCDWFTVHVTHKSCLLRISFSNPEEIVLYVIAQIGIRTAQV